MVGGSGWLFRRERVPQDGPSAVTAVTDTVAAASSSASNAPSQDGHTAPALAYEQGTSTASHSALDDPSIVLPTGGLTGPSLSGNRGSPDSGPSPSGYSDTALVPPSALHTLTERKLEKAVLGRGGRAVGLRQLVLLSNAFASKSRAAILPVSAEQHRLQAEQDLLDLEDERERKKREEDWLDSVLDEMLTDEDDAAEEDDDQPEPPPAPSGFFGSMARLAEDAGQASARRQDEFKSPYVHLSFRDRYNASLSSAPTTSTSTEHATAEEVETDTDLSPAVTSLLTFPTLPVRDSGFLEPSQIPLPPSRESSANSDDDGASEASSISDDEDREMEESEDLLTRKASPPIAIPIPRSSNAGWIGQSIDGPSTPDLAYSVGSVLTNVSTSPSSHSFEAMTPESSPPCLAFLGRYHQEKAVHEDTEHADSVHALQSQDPMSLSAEVKEALMMRMDGLDGYSGKEEPEDSAEGLEGSSEKHQPPIPSNSASSQELVKYSPPRPAHAIELNETFRIPDSPLPRLPDSLVSSLFGRTASPSAGPGKAGESDKPVSRKQKTHSYFAPPEQSQTELKLPMFLPHDIVKSIFDSVDFGLPPSSHASRVYTPTGIDSVPIARRTMYPKSAPNSLPSSPRSRTVNLAGDSSHAGRTAVGHDSTGSLLFSSLEALASRTSEEEGDSADSFGRGIVREFELGSRRRRERASAASTVDAVKRNRNESRSPSRLSSIYHPLTGSIAEVD